VGEAITVRQTGADNASATIKWYSVTPTKDVEIVSARNQLTYTPTTADYDIKVVATGTGDSKGCNSTLTYSPTSDSSALIDEYFADFFEEELFEEF
ncbi:MAG: hypothetical protein IJL92_02615, partial [Thermoguttaceae bacterium]|nr:hypothetical protein [Thermoguttaceae bacterium]